MISALGAATVIYAADVDGSKDHPLLSRYEGSQITHYKFDEFNEYDLVTKKIPGGGGLAANPTSATSLEGALTKIMYVSPTGRSTLEVFRNYENALSDAGFETLFTCKNNDCGGLYFMQEVGEDSWMDAGDQRYLAAKLARDAGDIFVALYVSSSRLRPTGGVFEQLHVIEIEAMQEGMVSVDADAMSEGIGQDGRIALYGILFDSGKAEIKVGSTSTLAQISKMLIANSEMNIVIVGHTDNVGELDYNMDLSTRRAKAVESALTVDYGIEGDRLDAWGVGYLSPVATNRNEMGREKNRRVELIEK
jgi:OOP family OmpA-OmpF porin